MNIQWTNNYPSKDVLKKDVDAMVNSTLNTLFKYFNKKDIYGIYYKGSSSKPWNSIIDYIPDISDVDIHVQFNDDAIFDKVIKNPDVAMKFSEDITKQFIRTNKNFYHMPELQLNSLNKLHHSKDYRSSSAKIVKVLYGKPYPLTKMSEKKIRKISHDQIIELRAFVDKLPNRLLDKNFSSMKKYLKDLSWRVNPQAANFLVFNNISYNDAFSINRTYITTKFRQLGFKDIADNFEGFYYHAWRYYLKNDYSDIKKSINYAYLFLDKTISIVEKSRK